jgi:hypothetical protein
MSQQHMNLLLPILSWLLFANTKIENAPKSKFFPLQGTRDKSLSPGYSHLIHAIPDKSQIPMTSSTRQSQNASFF